MRYGSISRGFGMSRPVCFGRSSFPEQSGRGFRPIYHRGSVNHCPGCDGVQWYIGRISAECAFCGTALPLQEAMAKQAGPFRDLGIFDRERLQPSL